MNHVWLIEIRLNPKVGLKDDPGHEWHPSVVKSPFSKKISALRVAKQERMLVDHKWQFRVAKYVRSR